MKLLFHRQKHAWRAGLLFFFFCGSMAVLLLCGCAGSRPAAAIQRVEAAALQPVGRTYLVGNKLALAGTASHFTCSFSGTQCKLVVSLSTPTGHNYLQYEIDGAYRQVITVTGNADQAVVIPAGSDGLHTITIYKNTEAQTGPVLVTAMEGKNIQAVGSQGKPGIEFIGNSITCGAAADASRYPCGQGAYHDHHDGYHAYGPALARKLQVDCMVSSVSGIGVYRNWNSNGPTMPQVYEKTDLTAGSNQHWDFSRFTPQVVSIALGTNDFSKGDGKQARPAFDSTAFITAYVDFVQLVRKKYPKAAITLLSSPMLSGKESALLERCLLSVKRRAERGNPLMGVVHTYFFKPMKAEGCDGHPSVAQHNQLADELLPFFKKLLQPQQGN